MKRFLLGLIFVILVAAATWWWLNRNTQPATAPAPNQTERSAEENSEETAPTSSQVVTYTGNGFSPATLTVKVGTKVTFRSSGGSMWVASGPHPAHTAYPEFNAERSYTSGQEYSFTFSRAGTWTYHNHNNPSHQGTIRVE